MKKEKQSYSCSIFCTIHNPTSSKPHYYFTQIPWIYNIEHKIETEKAQTPETVSSKHRFLSWCAVKTWTLCPWDTSSTISLSAPLSHQIHKYSHQQQQKEEVEITYAQKIIATFNFHLPFWPSSIWSDPFQFRTKNRSWSFSVLNFTHRRIRRREEKRNEWRRISGPPSAKAPSSALFCRRWLYLHCWNQQMAWDSAQVHFTTAAAAATTPWKCRKCPWVISRFFIWKSCCCFKANFQFLSWNLMSELDLWLHFEFVCAAPAELVLDWALVV